MIKSLDTHFKYTILPISIFIFIFIGYTSYYEIDEIIRGKGKVITGTKQQVIQHFEGGIVEEIYVKETQTVSKGDSLMKIKNIFFDTSLKEANIKMDVINLALKRLESLYKEKKLVYTKKEREKYPSIIKIEELIYKEEISKLLNMINKVGQVLKQEKYKLRENEVRLTNKKIERKIMKESYDITNNLYKKESVSRKEYLEAKLSYQKINTEIEELKNTKPIIGKRITEKQEEIKLYKNELKIKYLEIINLKKAELKTLTQHIKAFKDRNKRMLIKSPIDGIINTINKNTISGVIKNGEDIIEITPMEKEKIIEAEIEDRDRSKIWVGQKVKIEVTAYEYSNYGFLEGQIISISPDSYMRKNNNSVYYLIKIKTKENTIAGNELLPGMTTNVNVVTGKKTIMEYILKPLKNIKKSAFTEI